MKHKYIRKITRVGKRSLALVIPAPIVDELRLQEKQKMVITSDRKKIIVKDWKKKASRHSRG